MENKLKIVLAEDEPAILRGLILAISQISDHYDIAATACNGAKALEHILNIKPDIVITDIQMPVMNGLDLIEAAAPKSPGTSFIILTGYSDFLYAKRAVKLNVADYLLKPVDPDELEALLKKLEKENVRKCRNEQLDYISKHLYSETHSTIDGCLLNGCTVYLMFAFFGSVTTNLYNEMTIGSQIAQDKDYAPFYEMANQYETDLRILRGNYFNEKIFVFTQNAGNSSSDIPELVEQKIYPGILTDDIFINCILSEKISDGACLSEQIRRCYFYAASHALFGRSMLFVCHPIARSASPICVSPEIEEQLIRLKPVMDISDMENMCRSFITIWSGHHTSHFQIQTDLQCIFHAMTQKTDQLRRTYPNPSELLCAASSYDDLFENILLEFRKIYEGQNTIPAQPKSTLELACRVRAYLDKNYARTLTYKDFNDIFSYNEKYISLVFKEAFDISPSKYITELRMTAAKNLLCQNPDILLKDVAAAIGYDDQLYFSRVFKNSEGVSPKAYQKNHHSKNISRD